MFNLSTDQKAELKRVSFISLLLNGLFLLPVLTGISNLGQFDSDWHFYALETVRKSILEYGQFPMWDPWHMGGMPLIGNPQSAFSPFYIPVLLFGTVIGAKLALFFLQFAGFMGTYYLARHFDLDNIGGLIAAVIWSFSGMQAAQIQAGWFLFSHLHLIPWLFLCFFKFNGDIRMAAPMGFLLALTFLGGGPYPYPIALFPLGIIATVFLITKKSARPLLFLAVSIGVSALVAAVKLLPALYWMSLNPRDLENTIEGYSLAALFWSLTLPNISDLLFNSSGLYTTGSIPGTKFYVALEYGIYVGPIALLLAVAGFFKKFPHKPAVIIALIALLLVVMGDYAVFPLWDLLKKLPVYDSMRVVTRFRWPMLLILSLLAAFGTRRLSTLLNVRGFFGRAILLALIINLYMVSWPILHKSFQVPEKTALLNFNGTGEYFQVWSKRWYGRHGWMEQNRFLVPAMFPYLMQNIGVTRGYEPFNLEIFARGKGSPEYKGEAFIHSPPDFLAAKISEWSPNRVVVSWKEGIRGDLYLNQNYYPGWKVCDKSGLKLASSGLIKVEISEGDSRVTLCYTPARVYAGIAVSLISTLVLIAYLFTIYSRQKSWEPKGS